MILRIVIGAALSIAISISAAAQTPAAQIPSAQNAGPVVSPAKRELIRELYTAMKIDQMAEKSAVIMLDQLNKQLPMLLAQVLGDSFDLKGKTREEFEKTLIQSAERVNARIKELLPQRINWSGTMEQIFFPIYDKHFTETELKDLVAFYKSPTGQKAILVMPDLMRESVDKSTELMNPKMVQLLNEVLEEEKQRLLKK